jgi:hypothetical protein
LLAAAVIGRYTLEFAARFPMLDRWTLDARDATRRAGNRSARNSAVMPNLAPPPIAVGRFRLLFDWRGDRFGHSVKFVASAAGDQIPRTLLESVEGKPDEAWPASPVLQEFHCETRDEGRIVALLVGRAGKSHWSLSVLCDPRREALLFEAACRFGPSPQWLGSRYVAHAASPATLEPIDQIADRPNAQPGVLLSRADGGIILGSVGNVSAPAGPIWRFQAEAVEPLGGAGFLSGPFETGRRGPSPDSRPQELLLAANIGPADDGFRTVSWSYRLGAA